VLLVNLPEKNARPAGSPGALGKEKDSLRRLSVGCRWSRPRGKRGTIAALELVLGKHQRGSLSEAALSCSTRKNSGAGERVLAGSFLKKKTELAGQGQSGLVGHRARGNERERRRRSARRITAGALTLAAEATARRVLAGSKVGDVDRRRRMGEKNGDRDGREGRRPRRAEKRCVLQALSSRRETYLRREGFRAQRLLLAVEKNASRPGGRRGASCKGADWRTRGRLSQLDLARRGLRPELARPGGRAEHLDVRKRSRNEAAAARRKKRTSASRKRGRSCMRSSPDSRKKRRRPHGIA